MPKAGQNMPTDYNFSAEKLREPWGNMAYRHKFVDGEYVRDDSPLSEYPKAKYHPDYVHEQKEGTIYGFTECAQIVNSKEEEDQLGTEWKDSPAAFGHITAPDTKAVALKRIEEAKQAGQWRKGANIPNEQVTEKHLDFARENGVPELETMADFYRFLATLTSTQMREFMKESGEWIKANSPEPVKRGPGRPPREAVSA